MYILILTLRLANSLRTHSTEFESHPLEAKFFHFNLGYAAFKQSDWLLKYLSTNHNALNDLITK